MTNNPAIVLVLASLAAAHALALGQPPPGQWLSEPAPFPFGYDAALVRSNEFSGLRAEALVGRLKVFWPAASPPASSNVVAYASADAPGHWPARDWRPHSMVRRGGHWETTLPVEDLDTPQVYFLAVLKLAGDALPSADAVLALSPMQVVRPASVGLEEPTRLPWSFLEGFEEDLASWRLLSPELGYDAPVKTPDARTGDHALSVRVPAGKRSVTIATTRVRGRQLTQNNASALRLWIKTKAGEGRARVSPYANAMTDRQVTATWPRETSLAGDWREVNLPFDELPRFPLAGVDLLAIELIGQGPMEFLLDDLEMVAGGTAPD